MPHGLSKNAMQKNQEKKIILTFFVAVAAEPVQGGRTRGEYKT